MTSAVATKANNGHALMESVLIKGDLSKLSPQERSSYYLKVCESVGLNPLTKPFEYITLNNKLTLYALRACTDQLRTINAVSVLELNESEREGVYIVTAKVQDGKGRTDMAKGAVTVAGLRGDALANAMMKAETKAKRRATLSICGLGFLDETEIETIPAAARKPVASNVSPINPQSAAIPHDPETGEVHEGDGLDIPAALDRRPKNVPRTISVPQAGGANDWIAFGQQYIAAINGCKSLDEANEWFECNQFSLDVMKQEAPKVHARMTNAVAKTRAALVTPDDLIGPADGEILMAG